MNYLINMNKHKHQAKQMLATPSIVSQTGVDQFKVKSMTYVNVFYWYVS